MEDFDRDEAIDRLRDQKEAEFLAQAERDLEGFFAIPSGLAPGWEDVEDLIQERAEALTQEWAEEELEPLGDEELAEMTQEEAVEEE
jgi:hypothetical protein